MKRLLFRIGLLGLTVYAGICLIVFFFQRSLIYFPGAVPAAGPHTLKLDLGDRSLHVAARPRETPQAILYFGGNAEDVAYTLAEFSAAFPEHAVYLMYYRGYGGSLGRPTEPGLHADAQALFEWVHHRHPQVIVVGRSLGSGIAIQLAAHQDVARLVLVTPFDSLLNIAKRQFPFLPVGPLRLDKYESWRIAPQVSAKTQIIAAAHDEIIPLANTRRLAEAFRPGVATLHILAGATHNDLSTTGEYPALILTD